MGKVPGCKACEDRHKYFLEALQAFENIRYLFEEAKKSFEEAIESDKSLCFACKFWLKNRYGLGVRK